MLMNKFSDVSRFLAHQAPMILIDSLIDVTELTIHCQVEIKAGGMFFDKQINAVPAWVGIEFMAQTVAVWSGYHANLNGEPSPIGFLLGSRRYNSACELYKQGDILDVYGKQLMENEGMTSFECRIERDGKEIATSQLNAFVPSQDKLDEMLKGSNDD